MTNSGFSKGDPIYYPGVGLNTFPGIVLTFTEKRVQIQYDHWTGEKTAWVKPSKIEHQDHGQK